MYLRDFVKELDEQGKLVHIEREVDTHLEAATILAKLEGHVVKFEKIKGHDLQVIGGTGSSRDLIAASMHITKPELLFKQSDATKNPTPVETVENAPCQEKVITDVDLEKLPLLHHFEKDGGPYLSSGLFIANHPEHGLNASTHRAMYFGEKNKLVVRICHRDLLLYLKREGELDVAMALGVHPATTLAGATRITPDTNELEIANTLNPIQVTKCVDKDLVVPAGCEIVFEGKITTEERHREGPFVDITGTYDMPERQEPIFTVEKITMRNDAFYHALLPGMGEHRLMMGMPREPTIYNEVNKVCECVNARLSPGGCGWLHGYVQIKKKNADDGKKAIEAAFKGHPSMKHVWIVDDDIDFYDMDQIEWAVATRSQAGNDVVIIESAGSSVDPSSEFQEGTDRKKGWKLGWDATVPSDKPHNEFEAPVLPDLKLEDYVDVKKVRK